MQMNDDVNKRGESQKYDGHGDELEKYLFYILKCYSINWSKKKSKANFCHSKEMQVDKY